MSKKKDAYAKAGVDIDAATKAVKMMKEHVRSTHNSHVLSSMSSFGGMHDVSFFKGFRRPVLVQSADGVGTKVKIAEMMNNYSVGQCIVNHCVNDILSHGARPLTFLDYVASDKLTPEVMAEIVANMAIACRENEVSLTGGETAEMPGVYCSNSHDIVGMITGIVEKDEIIDGSLIAENDVMIGLPSNGLHTNGYSLARKAFFETGDYAIDSYPSGLGGLSVGEELLRIHKSYLHLVMSLLNSDGIKIHGIAHITGGGFFDNIGRLIKKGLCAEISKKWSIPAVFRLIQRIEKVPDKEMRKVFNLGIGMVLIVPRDQGKVTRKILAQNGEPHSIVIGSIVKSGKKEKVVFTY
jgi:phosphoribosylformylglycinamidine cyclo-ligase